MHLAPLDYVVVAADRAAFTSTYGAGIPVAGQYSSRLSDQGENLVLALAAPFEAAIMRFGYSDAWYPATDGGGKSLTIKDPAAPPVSWNNSESWQPSEPTPGGP
jgi:hypothetical protein